MMRSIFTGVLVLAVVGGGYWFLKGDDTPATGALLHTPEPSLKDSGKGERVAKAKARMRQATKGAPEKPAPVKKKEPAKIAAAEPKPLPTKKKSSNNAFAGLKASALAAKAAPKKPAAKPSPAKPSPAKAGTAPAKREAGPRLAAQGAKVTPSSQGMERVGTTPVQGLSLPRIALATGVEKREPVALASSFRNGSRVHLFMEAKNLSDQNLTLLVHWHDPALAHPVTIPLKVPAHKARYRTWANSSPIKRAGPHEVSVQVKDGPEIYRRAFTVLAAKLPATKDLNNSAAR